MAFVKKNGTYTSPNELIDALAEVWDFDEETLSGEYHSVRWGATELRATANDVVFYFNGAPSGGSRTLSTNVTGTYKICRAAKGMMCIVNAASAVTPTAVAFSTARNVDDENDVSHMTASVMVNNYIYLGAGSQEAVTRVMDLTIAVATSAAIQTMPYLHQYGDYAADNLYQIYKTNNASMTDRCYIDGELYCVFKSIAVKDEGGAVIN